MPARFTVLASGSSGNASLLEVNGHGLLVDMGLGPRQLTARLATYGMSWNSVHAVILTHTHSDHWNERSLNQLLQRKLPLYCHHDHADGLHLASDLFRKLRAAQLVRTYDDREVMLPSGVRCRPFPVSHDGTATFGFRFEGPGSLFSSPWALGYAADLGMWDETVLSQLIDSDILALEFNHDVQMERNSGRSAYLIARVLGDSGHLSNDQASALLEAVVQRSRPGRLQHLIQLHLSRQCNEPSLAAAVARGVLEQLHPQTMVHTARQDRAGPSLHLGQTDGAPLADITLT